MFFWVRSHDFCVSLRGDDCSLRPFRRLVGCRAGGIGMIFLSLCSGLFQGKCLLHSRRFDSCMMVALSKNE